MQLKVTTVSEILSFSEICSKYCDDIDAVSGRYCINAKSFMGMLALDYSKPIKIVIHREKSTTEDYNKILIELKSYLSE